MAVGAARNASAHADWDLPRHRYSNRRRIENFGFVIDCVVGLVQDERPFAGQLEFALWSVSCRRALIAFW
jgi:hypothetical protein